MLNYELARGMNNVIKNLKIGLAKLILPGTAGVPCLDWKCRISLAHVFKKIQHSKHPCQHFQNSHCSNRVN